MGDGVDISWLFVLVSSCIYLFSKFMRSSLYYLVAGTGPRELYHYLDSLFHHPNAVTGGFNPGAHMKARASLPASGNERELF